MLVFFKFDPYYYYSYVYNGVPLHKWVAVAKQAITEMNLSANFDYQPIWSEEMRRLGTEFVKKILAAKTASEKNIEEMTRKIKSQHQGNLYFIFYLFGQLNKQIFLTPSVARWASTEGCRFDFAMKQIFI